MKDYMMIVLLNVISALTYIGIMVVVDYIMFNCGVCTVIIGIVFDCVLVYDYYRSFKLSIDAIEELTQH